MDNRAGLDDGTVSIEPESDFDRARFEEIQSLLIGGVCFYSDSSSTESCPMAPS